MAMASLSSGGAGRSVVAPIQGGARLMCIGSAPKARQVLIEQWCGLRAALVAIGLRGQEGQGIRGVRRIGKVCAVLLEASIGSGPVAHFQLALADKKCGWLLKARHCRMPARTHAFELI